MHGLAGIIWFIPVIAINMLNVKLFGPPALTYQGRAVNFHAPPRTMPLLAYLLLQRAQPLDRQQVAFTLWPDDAESDARTNLRRHLHHLQQALPPAQNHPWLLVNPRTVQWNPAAEYQLDVAEFERLAGAPQTLAQAIPLYTGDLLETIYDDWVFFERERLSNLYFTSLGQLIYDHRTRRDYTAAIHYAGLVLARDPLREDTVRQLLALRYESGDRAGALAEYERFSKQLKQEMGVLPMPETQALYESILHHAHISGIESIDSSDEVSTAHRVSARLPLVGRQTEMDRLTTRWSRAARGYGGLLLIGGEAGIGKTRLTQELALLAESQGARILRGATSQQNPRPHQALIEAFQSVLPLLINLEGELNRLSALAALIPELPRRCNLPHLPGLDPDRERIRLFDAAAGCLEKLAAPRPVLLILEDLHWAGETSIALLEYLVRRIAGAPILVVGTYRDEEIPHHHPLQTLRHNLTSGRVPDSTLLMENLLLGPLSSQAVEALITQMAPEQPQLAGRLFNESEGNPLFIDLLWQHWQAHEDDEDGMTLPGGINAAISRRLGDLQPESRAYAEVAAVIGAQFDAEAVRTVGGWSEVQAYTALSGLLDNHLVQDVEGRSRYDYRFAHHLIQATLYAEIPSAKRKRRHLRVAEVLEALYADQRAELAGDLATHYDQGGAPERAVPCYLLSAQTALRMFADTEALRALNRALQLVSEDPALADLSVQVDLLLLRESIHYRQGKLAAQQSDLQQLELLALASPDPDLAFELIKRQIMYYRRMDDRPTQARLIEAFKRQTQTQGNQRWQAEALYTEACYLKIIDDYPAAIAGFQSALGQYAELQDIQGQIQCCCAVAEIYMTLRQNQMVDDWIQQALALGRAATPTDAFLRTLWNLAAKGLTGSDKPRCLQYGQKCLTMAESVGDVFWQGNAHRLLGIALTGLFRVEDARNHLGAALELFRRMQKNKNIALTLQSLASLFAATGDYDQARQHYQKAFELQEQMADLGGMTTESINLAFIASKQGDYLAERQYSLQAVELTQKTGNRFLEAAGLHNLGEAERELGDISSAREHLNAAIDIFRELDLPSDLCSVESELALLELSLGNIDAAMKIAAELLALYPRVESQHDNCHRFLWYAARALRTGGNESEAGAVLERAYQAVQADMQAIAEAESRQKYLQIKQNQEIIAAYERGEWPAE